MEPEPGCFLHCLKFVRKGLLANLYLPFNKKINKLANLQALQIKTSGNLTNLSNVKSYFCENLFFCMPHDSGKPD